MRPAGGSPALQAVLAAVDLDVLADRVESLGAPDDTDASVVRHVVAQWSDQQALANLLLHPAVLPHDVRVPALLRGLMTGGYLTLAAAVGAGRLPARAVDARQRVQLVQALLDTVVTTVGTTARRAATALRPLVSAADADELVELLGHPDPVVRADLEQALVSRLSPAELREALDSAAPAVAAVARRHLAQDGVDLDSPSPPALARTLSWIPDLGQWLAREADAAGSAQTASRE